MVSLAAAVLRRKPETPVLVKADQKVPYGRVVEAMVLLQQAGAAKVGFLDRSAGPVPPRGAVQPDQARTCRSPHGSHALTLRNDFLREHSAVLGGSVALHLALLVAADPQSRT